jgi:hypothetical protein
MNRTWAIAGTLTLLPLLAIAQVHIAGRVVNETNAPVSGAKVVLRDVQSTKRYSAVSDPTGAFSLQTPAAGEYLLNVDREGFYVLSDRKVAIAGPSFDLQVSLQSVHEMESSINVSGKAGVIDMDRVTPQATLSSRTLYDVPFPNQNSLRSGLRMLPGLIQDSVGGIHLYGGSENQAEYSFEGFQLNDPLTGRFDARMSLESVQSVDIQASPASAEWGRGPAGTMMLHARTGGDKFNYSATSVFPGIDMGNGLRVSNWTPRGYLSGPWRRGRAWFFNTTELQFVRITVPQLPAGQNSAKSWRFNDLLHNQINLSPNNILFIGLLFNFWNAPQSGITYLDPRATTVNRSSRQWFGYVKDQHSFGRSSLIEFGVATSLTHSREVPQGNKPYLITPSGRRGNSYSDASRDAVREQGLLNYFLPSFHWFGEHRFKTGADIVQLSYEQNISRSSIDYLNNSGAIVRNIVFSGSGHFNRSNYESAVYFQDSWRVRPWLLAEVGWRADHDRLLNRLNMSARAGFAISPPGMENMRIAGGYARIVEPSNLRLFTRPLDQSAISTYFSAASNIIYGPVTSVFAFNPNMRSPHADVLNLGVDRVLPKQMHVKVQLLRRRFKDGFEYQNSLPVLQQLPAILSGEPNPGPLTALYSLSNHRQDQYDSAEIALHQPLRGRFEWMVSYTRSRTQSNAVIERTIDQPLSVPGNRGPLPWDSPNRLMSWGYLPVIGKSWAIAYLVDWHTGLPFSIQDQFGQLAGPVNDHRLRQFFELNFYVERQLSLRGYRTVARAGFNNITGHFNPNLVDNVLGGATFLRMYGGQARSLNFRMRFIGRQ